MPATEIRPVAVGAERTEILEAPECFAETFRRRRSIVCPDILDPALVESLLDRCRRGCFVAEYVEPLGSREVEAPQRVGGALNLMLSRAPFLRWVEAVTGYRGLVRVEGRVVQTRANGADQLDWHNDMEVGPRRLGITISLSDAPYEGGDFELRAVGSRDLLTAYHHERNGTALIFDVAYGIEHRVLPVSGGGTRRVFTGWFLQSPNEAVGSGQPGTP